MDRPFEALGMRTPLPDLDALHVFVKKLKAKFGRIRVIEVGSWVGLSAKVLIESGADEIHCVDTWHGSEWDKTGNLGHKLGSRAVFEEFCKNIGRENMFSKVWPHVGTSELYATIWPWDADLIFLDADHRYHSIKQDIALWTQHVREGGILCGHDYFTNPEHGIGFPGVMKAVRESGPVTRAGFHIWYREIHHKESQCPKSTSALPASPSETPKRPLRRIGSSTRR